MWFSRNRFTNSKQKVKLALLKHEFQELERRKTRQSRLVNLSRGRLFQCSCSSGPAIFFLIAHSSSLGVGCKGVLGGWGCESMRRLSGGGPRSHFGERTGSMQNQRHAMLLRWGSISCGIAFDIHGTFRSLCLGHADSGIEIGGLVGEKAVTTIMANYYVCYTTIYVC